MTDPTIFPIVSDAKISQMRQRIIMMMEETRDLEITGNSPSVRYYKMTEEEYQSAKMQFYVITIFLGKFPHSETKTEGFAYDIRTLIKEKYIVLNEQVCYFPIPLSAKRWNFLRNKYADIGDYTYNTGLLTFPIYRAELTYIFKNIRNGPIICSSREGCVSISLEQLQGIIGLLRFSDESVGNRFGNVKAEVAPTIIPPPSPINSVPSAIFPPPLLMIEGAKAVDGVRAMEIAKPMDEDRITRIIDQVEKELKDIQVEDAEIYTQLRSDQTRQYIRDLMEKQKLDDVHIISFLISDSLDKVLSKK